MTSTPEAKMREALEQLLDDMGETGLCVCQAAKDLAREALSLPSGWQPIALDDIAAERRRQVEAEGWTTAHDDRHVSHDLASAAACYALGATINTACRNVMDQFRDKSATPNWVLRHWPWSDNWWKPTSRRRDLVKAGALIVAEIERLDRMSSLSPLPQELPNE